MHAKYKGTTMKTIDAVGLRCPQPILKLTIAMPEMAQGEVLEIAADCDTFESDVRMWCERMKKTLLAVYRDGERITCQIQF